MGVACASCGRTFETTRSTARYCSGKCRKRAADLRSRSGQVVPIDAPRASTRGKTVTDVPARTGIGSAMLEEFPAGLLSSTTGALALKLAADIDSASPGSPGVAALVRELRAVLAELTAAKAPTVANPLVLLRQRHDAGRASG